MIKKILLFSLCILIVLPILSLTANARCIYSSEDYAVEVLLNKPGIGDNIKLLDKADNIISDSRGYILKSRYNESLAVVVSEVSNPICDGCLDIILQVPTKSVKKDIPYLAILLKNLGSELQIDKTVTSYNNWKINCNLAEEHCEFKKGRMSIITDKVADKYQAVVELNDNFYSCSNCNGICLHKLVEGFCVSRNIEQDLRDVLQFVGFLENSDNAFSSHTVLDKGVRRSYEVQPIVDIDADWTEALKTDLVWLRRTGVLFISDLDIERISQLADIGKSGNNSRIVYGQDIVGRRDWFYDYETRTAQPIETENCEAFPISKIPQDYIYFSDTGLSIYYTIPLFVSIFILGILLLLIIIGRLSTVKQSSQKQPAE